MLKNVLPLTTLCIVLLKWNFVFKKLVSSCCLGLCLVRSRLPLRKIEKQLHVILKIDLLCKELVSSCYLELCLENVCFPVQGQCCKEHKNGFWSIPALLNETCVGNLFKYLQWSFHYSYNKIEIPAVICAWTQTKYKLSPDAFNLKVRSVSVIVLFLLIVN